MAAGPVVMNGSSSSSAVSPPTLPGQFNYLGRSPSLAWSPGAEMAALANMSRSSDHERLSTLPHYIRAPPPFESRSSMRSTSLSPTRTSRSTRAFPPPGCFWPRASPNVQLPTAVSPPLQSQSQTQSHALSLSPTDARSRFTTNSLPSPSSPGYDVVQRLTHQNTLIREAWELERHHLEASRKRVEDVFREERAIMQAVREAWDVDRTALVDQLKTLTGRVQSLERENALLKALLPPAGPLVPGLTYPVKKPTTGPKAAWPSATPPLVSAPMRTTSLTGGISMQRRSSARPFFHLQLGTNSLHRSEPSSQSASICGAPMTSPIMTPPYTSVPLGDFASTPSPSESGAPVPVIDVQTIHPELDGIPIRANAVQKSTFIDTYLSTSRGSFASRTNLESIIEAPSPATEPFLGARLRDHGEFKERTLQVFAAEETCRLTMHAGHTPNHSLSLFPTVAATLVDQSRDSKSPHQGNAIGRADHNHAEPHPGDTHTDIESAKSTTTDGVISQLEFSSLEDPDSYADCGSPVELDMTNLTGSELKGFHLPEALDQELGFSLNVPLKAPLMLRNMPARDEVFLRLVNEKLEPISRGQESEINAIYDTIPTVISSDEQSANHDISEASPPVLRPPDSSMMGSRTEGNIGELDADSDYLYGQDDTDNKVSLKLRSTSNFGAPFGAI